MLLGMSAAAIRRPTVGTLAGGANGLTCSEIVARDRYGIDLVRPSDTFEGALSQLRLGKVDQVLVPAAYPLVRNWIMATDLRVIDTFIAPIVPLVLASPDLITPDPARVAFFHPATESILATLGIEILERVPCESNPEAARRASVLEEAVAITNLPSAEAYGLHVLTVLRPSLHMPWLLFRLAEPRLDEERPTHTFEPTPST